MDNTRKMFINLVGTLNNKLTIPLRQILSNHMKGGCHASTMGQIWHVCVRLIV